jgi:hypothetical protein
LKASIPKRRSFHQDTVMHVFRVDPLHVAQHLFLKSVQSVIRLTSIEVSVQCNPRAMLLALDGISISNTSFLLGLTVFHGDIGLFETYMNQHVLISMLCTTDLLYRNNHVAFYNQRFYIRPRVAAARFLCIPMISHPQLRRYSATILTAILLRHTYIILFWALPSIWRRTPCIMGTCCHTQDTKRNSGEIALTDGWVGEKDGGALLCVHDVDGTG